MAEHKPPPPLEVSLKYLAWDIKELSQTMKEIKSMLSTYIMELRGGRADASDDPRLPF